MANRWGNNGNNDRLYFLGLQMTADGDRSHEIKRCLLLGRKAMTNLGSILKSRDITLPTKVCLVKVMVFPVVMNGCESWTVKKAERRRIDAFQLWCWRRLLRVLWTARSNQSVLKEIGPEYSLEGLCAAVHRVTKSRTRLSDWTELNCLDGDRLPSPALGGDVAKGKGGRNLHHFWIYASHRYILLFTYACVCACARVHTHTHKWTHS